MTKRGLLITNSFLISDKFNELYVYLTQAAKKLGIFLDHISNSDLLSIYSGSEASYEKKMITRKTAIPLKEYDFVLFWDKDIRLARSLEKMGLRVYNSSDAIEICDDKSLTCERLSGKIKMPLTIMAPMTYSNTGYTDYKFLDLVETELKYPLIIKECFGSFGYQVYLAGSREDAVKIISSIKYPFLFQEYIDNSKGRDIRLQVVGDRVIASMLRTNPDDFRANITNGGSMSEYNPSAEECEMALRACKLLGMDFAGVDILFGRDTPILCEINSNAHFKNIYSCTGVNVAESILEYIIKDI
ncbi:MAG: RimK family alpha-L-glutamate ligase [Lachnospiraceae bacterium]|nr:RimK family alpha-L-glutamate ligase [Lachnospiraceae bacterium]